MTTMQGHRNRTSQASWHQNRGLRKAREDRDAASRWLRSTLAAALQSSRELDNARSWYRDPAPADGELLSAWLADTYRFTPEALPDRAHPAAAMALTSQWMADRARRVNGATLLASSPDAGAVICAAAQALTPADLAIMAGAAHTYPHASAHLALSTPLTHEAGDDLDTTCAITWWHDSDTFHLVDWIPTRSQLDAAQTRNAALEARQFGEQLPDVMFNGELWLAQPHTGSAPADPALSEGQFAAGALLSDPEQDLLPRVALAARHLIESGVLDTTEHPHISEGLTVTLPGEDRHSCSLGDGDTVATIRRRRGHDGAITWTTPTWCRPDEL